MVVGIVITVIGVSLFISQLSRSSFYSYTVAESTSGKIYTPKRQKLVYNMIATSCVIIGLYLSMLVA